MTRAVPLEVETKLLAAVKELETVLRELPRSDRVGKISGMIWRLSEDLEGGRDIESTVRRLVDTTRDTVENDPWVRLDRIAQCLPVILNSSHSTDSAADAPSVSGVTAVPLSTVSAAATPPPA